MPNVRVVPVYVEVVDVERAVMALESHLRQAGYIFYTGEPLAESLEQAKKRMAAERFTSGAADGAGEVIGIRP